MSEMMSEEISRVMTEQRELEQEYARLIQLRGELKGLSNKGELRETKQQIQEVSRKLKESTRTLCRVLKDNPDVEGNQKKIQTDREQLTKCLVETLGEDINVSAFQDFLAREKEQQGELEKLRLEEKNLLAELKQTKLDHDAAKETAAKNEEENNQDIKKLKKSLNEAQTDSELYLKYLEQEHEGIQDCQMRQYRQVETKLSDEIDYLQTQIEKEKTVHEQIDTFLSRRRDELETEGD